MTGDGLRFAVRGGELAARRGARRARARMGRRSPAAGGERRAEFAAKWRFNRAAAVARRVAGGRRAAHRGRARLAPSALRAAIVYAGDVGYA